MSSSRELEEIIKSLKAAKEYLKKAAKEEELAKAKLLGNIVLPKKTAEDIADELIKSLDLVKAINGVTGQTTRTNVNTKSGWSQDPATGGFHHKVHGVISTVKEPDGQFSVRHSGRILGTYPDIPTAGAKIKEHIGYLGSFKGGSPVNSYAKKTDMNKAAQQAEQQVMARLAKTVGAMMPQSNRSLQPSQAEFEAAMTAQGYGMTQEQADELNKSWDNKMNDFFSAASAPISSRFKSEEEEMEYWANIKVRDSGDGGSGY